MPTLIYNLATSRVKSVAFHPRRPWALIACHDGFVELHDYVVGALVDRFLAHSAPVRACAFHETQPLFATGSDDRTIKLWDLETRKELATLSGHSDYIRFIDFHKVRPWISSASDDCTVKIWNFYSRQCIGSCTGHKEFAMCCRFHPYDDLLATAGLDGTVRIWDLTKLSSAQAYKKSMVEKTLYKVLSLPQCTISLSINGEAHTRGVNWVCWGENDGLYSSADDFTIREWRLLRGKPQTGELLGIDATLYSHATMTGHSGNVNAVEVGRDNVVISASSDGTIRVYEYQSRTFVGAISAADYGVLSRDYPCRFWCLAYHPKQALWAAGHDCGMFIFSVIDNQRIASFRYGAHVFFCKGMNLVSCYMGSDNLSMYNKLALQVARNGSFGAGKRVVMPVAALPLGQPFPIIIQYDDGCNRYALSLMSAKSEVSRTFDCTSNVIKISNTQMLYYHSGQLIIATPSGEGASVQRAFKFSHNVTYLIQGFNANEFVACYERGEAEMIRINGDSLEIAKKLYFPYCIIDHTFSQEASLMAVRSNRSIFILSPDYEVVSQATISSNILAFTFAALGRGFEKAPDTTVIFTTSTHACYLCSRNNVSGVITSLNKELQIQMASGYNMLFLDEQLNPISVEFDSRLCGLMAAISDYRRGDAAMLVRRIKKNTFGNALTGRLIQTGYYKEAIDLVSEDNKALKQKLAIEMGDLPDEVEKEFYPSYVNEACNYQQWKKAFKYADCERQAFINVINGSNVELTYKNSSIYQQLSAAMMMHDNYKFAELLKKAGLEAAACVFSRARGLISEIGNAQFKYLDYGAKLLAPERSNELQNWPIKKQETTYFNISADEFDDNQLNKGVWEEEEPEEYAQDRPVDMEKAQQGESWSGSESEENNDDNCPDILNPRSQAFKATGLFANAKLTQMLLAEIKANSNALPFDSKQTDKLFSYAVDLTTKGYFYEAINYFYRSYAYYKFLQVESNKLSSNAATAIYYIRGLKAEILRQQVEEPKHMAYLALIFAQYQMMPQHRAKALKNAMVKLKKNNFGFMSRMCALELEKLSAELGTKGEELKAKAEQYKDCKGGEKMVQNFEFIVNYSTLTIEECKECCYCCESCGDDDEECQVCQCGWIE